MNSEGRSFQDRGNGYTEGPYGEFGPIEVSAGDASFRMTWTSAVCVYGTVALVLLFKGLLFFFENSESYQTLLTTVYLLCQN